jgi:hypothetical protein
MSSPVTQSSEMSVAREIDNLKKMLLNFKKKFICHIVLNSEGVPFELREYQSDEKALLDWPLGMCLVDDKIGNTILNRLNEVTGVEKVVCVLMFCSFVFPVILPLFHVFFLS